MTRELRNNLEDAIDGIKNGDYTRILRPQLRPSLEAKIGNRLRKMISTLDWLRTAALNCDDDLIKPIHDTLSGLISLFQQVYSLEDSEYLNHVEANREGVQFDQLFKKYREQLRDVASESIIGQEKPNVEEIKSLLEDARSVQNDFESFRTTVTNSKNDIAKFAKENEETVLQKVKETEQALLTARGENWKTSLKSACDEFQEGVKSNNKAVIYWGIISIVIFSVFIIACVIFYSEPPIYVLGTAIARSALRITILTAIAAGIAFSLRIFRSNLHMRELNKHRLRITKSMPSFIESAFSKEQRDLILSQMVNAITSFGNSGLLKGEDESVSTPRMIVDNLYRSLTGGNHS